MSYGSTICSPAVSNSVRSRTIDDLCVDLRFVHVGARSSTTAPTHYAAGAARAILAVGTAAAAAALRKDLWNYPWNGDECGGSGDDLAKPEDEP